MQILYIESSTQCGLFLSWPCVPTPNVCLIVRDPVEFYVIHMFLACRLKITFTSNLKLIISFLVQLHHHLFFSRQSLLLHLELACLFLFYCALSLAWGRKANYMSEKLRDKMPTLPTWDWIHSHSSIERYNFKHLYDLFIEIDCSSIFSRNFGLIGSVWLKHNRQRRLPLLSNPLTFEWLIRPFLPALCG